MITPLLLVIDRLYPVLHQLSLPRTRWIIIGAYLLLLSAIGLQQGILADKEALKYIGCAEEVIAGDFNDLTGNYLKYAAYVLFLVPFVAVGKAWLAIGVQIMLGVIAAEGLARFTERSTGNVGLGRLAMALFLLCPLIQTWTLALYTEHFFTCSIILFLERLGREQRFTPLVIALGLVTLFARPVGMFFVVPALLWRSRERLVGAWKPFIMPVGCVVLLLFAITVAHVEHAQLAPIASGQVIAGIDGHTVLDFEGSTVWDAQRYLFDKVGPAEWLLITGEKVLSLFTLTRAYYSAGHNVLNALFYALYPLTLLGLWRSWSNDRVRLVLALLLLNTLLVGLTHDEWSGRFIVPLLPWLIFMAVHGLKKSAANKPGV